MKFPSLFFWSSAIGKFDAHHSGDFSHLAHCLIVIPKLGNSWKMHRFSQHGKEEPARQSLIHWNSRPSQERARFTLKLERRQAWPAVLLSSSFSPQVWNKSTLWSIQLSYTKHLFIESTWVAVAAKEVLVRSLHKLTYKHTLFQRFSFIFPFSLYRIHVFFRSRLVWSVEASDTRRKWGSLRGWDFYLKQGRLCCLCAFVVSGEALVKSFWLESTY